MDSQDDWREPSRKLKGLDDALKPFYARIELKQDASCNWVLKPSEPERVLDVLYYFYSAAIVNNSEVFTYIPYMIEHKDALAAIGARGCLAALDNLEALSDEFEKLPTRELQNQFYHQHKSQREPGEALAEGSIEFASLLLAYARAHEALIGPETERPGK